MNRVYICLATYGTDTSYSLQFPASNTSDSGGGPLRDCTSSEGFWYFSEIAYDYLNYTNLQQLLNGYCYLTQQKQTLLEGTDKDFALTAGLAGWQPKIGIPNYNLTELVYTVEPPENIAFLSTATDADIHLLVLMYNSSKNFGINSLYYNTSSLFTNTGGICSYADISSISIDYSTAGLTQDLVPPQKAMTYTDPPLNTTLTETYSNFLTQAFCSFLTLDISNMPSSPYNDSNIGFFFCDSGSYSTSPVLCNFKYNPILCNDQYGGGGTQATALNPSYFDPVYLLSIYTIAQDLNFNSSTYAYAFYDGSDVGTKVYVLDNYVTAIKNGITYLKNLQSYYQDSDTNHINSYGLPDNPYWSESDVSQIYSLSQNQTYGNQPHYIGYDSIRVQQIFGYFAYLCANETITATNQDLYSQQNIDDIIIIGIRMMNYLINNCVNLYNADMYLPYLNSSTYGARMDGGSLIGPLCIAMTGLINFTSTDTMSPYYSTITPAHVTAIQNTLQTLTIDTNFFIYNPMVPELAWENWQPNYYPVCIILVCKSLLDKMLANPP